MFHKGKGVPKETSRVSFKNPVYFREGGAALINQ